ncbi:MAG: diguanylate cyclase, partial [Myxococcota bacterium]
MLEPSPPTILWYTTPERASWVESADLSGIHLLVTTEPTPGLTTDMVVLDTRAFSTTQELIRTRDGFTCPALLLTTADNVAEVLPHVGSDDEVALCDLPWPLLVHRIKRMLDRTQIHLDSLTRIPDRLSFLGWLALRTPQASAAQPVSMLLVDIDHFKAINDVYGHNTGDRILRRLAARLEEYLAAHVPEALLSRFGGEEFAILVDRDEQQTLALGQQLLHIVSAQPLVSDIILTVSIGAASSRRPVDPQQLIAQADQAIYACKAQGRNMALHYDAMAREAMRRGEDMDVTNFEHVTRVVADRVADLIARRSQKLFKSVKQEANRDALTGLPNRRYLDRLLTSRLEEAARMHHPLVFALIDIDHFGNINKTWGWPTGDKAL